MKLLGVDPGRTTGWCVYDTVARCVESSGKFDGHEWDFPNHILLCHAVVIEKPQGYGPTRPELVECGYVCGRLVESLLQHEMDVHELTRRDVKRILTDATQRDVVVTKDANAWAALLLLHGGELAGKKGGPLHNVKSHARAALAVAVAWALRAAQAVTQ